MEEIDMDSSSVPRKKRPITDEELSALLQEWKPVRAPASLEARVFSMAQRTPGGWSRMFSRSVRVPVPVVAMMVAIFLGLTVRSVVVEHNLPGATGIPLPLSQSSSAGPSATLVGRNPSGSWGAPEPQITPSPKRIQVPASVQAINTTYRVPPVYPPDARAKGVEGTVILDVIIAADGTVKDLTVLSGDGALAFAAVTAVQQWVFEPTLLNGEPVEVETTTAVTFTLHEPR
jgi:protein TonB